MMPIKVRKEVPRETKAAVWKKCKSTCWYCGKVLNPFFDYSIDHFDGDCSNNAVVNLVLACRGCNSRKHHYSIEEFRALLSRHVDGVCFSRKQAEVLRKHGFKFPEITFYFETLSDEGRISPPVRP